MAARVVFGIKTDNDPDAARRKSLSELAELPPHSHFLTVAAAGSGKSTAVLVPNLLGGWTGSAFVFDPKGELAWLTSLYRALPVAQGGLGQRVVIVDPFDQVRTRFWARLPPALQQRFPCPPVSGWNPLEGLREVAPDRTESDSFDDDLADVAEGFIKRSSREAHWDDSAKTLLRGMVAAELECGGTTLDGMWFNMRRPHGEWVETLLTGSTMADGQRIAPLLDRGRYAYRALARFGEKTDEVRSVIGNAITQCDFLDSRPIMRSLCAGGGAVRFGELAEQPMTVYLVLPPDKFNDRHGRWLRLALQRALSEVMRANRPASKVMFFLDEFGTVGALPAVETAFGLARGLGVSLWPFLQDLNQLQRDYPKSWQTFIANCTAELYFGINDSTTAEHVSKAWGEQERMRVSRPLVGAGGNISPHLEREVRIEHVMRETQGTWVAGKRVDGIMLWRVAGEFMRLMPAHYYALANLKARARPDPDFLTS